jgi:hypothetical protein
VVPVQHPRGLAEAAYWLDNEGMNPPNPRWLEPDEHELAIAARLEAAGLPVHLVASTPAQRKSRAQYWRKRSSDLAAARPGRTPTDGEGGSTAGPALSADADVRIGAPAPGPPPPAPILP